MLKVLPILIAVVAADAFGLSYQRYNKYLFDEFQSLNNDVSLSRHRRDADGTALLCCSGDKINNAMEVKMTQIEKECLSEYEESNRNNSDNSFSGREFLICINECLLRKLGTIDQNGKFNREELIKFYDVFEAGDIKWKKDALAGYVDACLTKVASNPKPTDKQCSTAAMDFDLCVVSKFILGCPADLRIDSESCNSYRKIVADLKL